MGCLQSRGGDRLGPEMSGTVAITTYLSKAPFVCDQGRFWSWFGADSQSLTHEVVKGLVGFKVALTGDDPPPFDVSQDSSGGGV